MIEVRDHLTERITRARLKLEVKRAVLPLVVVLVGVAVGLACAFYVAKNVGKNVYTKTHEVRFVVDDASGAVRGGRQDLRFKGLNAGKLMDVDLQDGNAVITAKVYDEFWPVYRDARAALRPTTALEDVYIDILDRGTKAAGPATRDTPLPARQTPSAVQVEDVLNAFDPDVRTHLATMLRDLGGGLRGRGELLRTSLVRIVPFVEVAARLSTQLAQRARSTRRLVHNTALLTDELARRERSLRSLVRHGGTTLRTLEAGSSDLEATLGELPGTLDAVDTSFTAVRRVLPDLDQALVSLRPAARALPAGLTAARRLALTARPAVRALRTPVQRLTPLADSLVPIAADLDSTFTSLRPQAGAIDHVTKSVAGCAVALQGFFQWTASLVKFDDARQGPGGRGDLALSLGSGATLADPNIEAPKSCAPGGPVGGTPGTGGDLRK
jgi:phospholipid/cholesterol/gamma-HCH transport system substrate-binding protein